MGERIMTFLSKRMIACDEAGFLVSYRSDRRLSIKQWWQLKFHMLTCHLCRKYAHQIEELNESMGQYSKICSDEIGQHHLTVDASTKLQHALEAELNSK